MRRRETKGERRGPRSAAWAGEDNFIRTCPVQPGGLPEISRGLRSAATTPPVQNRSGTTPEGSQNHPPSTRSVSGTPSAGTMQLNRDRSTAETERGAELKGHRLVAPARGEADRFLCALSRLGGVGPVFRRHCSGSGCEIFGRAIQGCRCAHPPATFYQPSGLLTSGPRLSTFVPRLLCKIFVNRSPS